MAACLSLTGQLKPCDVWMLTILPAIYGHFVIDFCIYYILHEENQSSLQTVVSARRLNQKLFATLTLYSDLHANCRTSCNPDLIYGPALISFGGNVPPWPYILACPSIWHLLLLLPLHCSEFSIWRCPLSRGNLRDRSWYVPSQWETLLQCNHISHWLGAYLVMTVSQSNLNSLWPSDTIWHVSLNLVNIGSDDGFSSVWLNSLWPTDAIWWQRSGSTLAQVMADGTKPLPEPMSTYHKSGPVMLIWGQFHKRYLSHWPVKSAWKLLI